MRRSSADVLEHALKHAVLEQNLWRKQPAMLKEENMLESLLKYW
jgi:hypothetical protein